jgi:hypothetical protein
MSWAVVAGVGASLVGSYLGSKGSGGDPYAQARADEEARRKEIHDAQKRIEGKNASRAFSHPRSGSSSTPTSLPLTATCCFRSWIGHAMLMRGN